MAVTICKGGVKVDKYEFNIKLDQIKKLCEKKDFKTASKIAKGMEWKKVKDWSVLSMVIAAHENAGDYEEAREVAVIAYNKNMGGRRLVYKLAEICVKLNDFNDANELYKDYSKMAPRDVNKYILLYKLRKAEGAPSTKLIRILEEYKEHEIDEMYLYELAMLYSQVGRTEDCLDECEEIILWFRDGIYVENAIKLKQKYVAITPSQQKILDDAKKKYEESMSLEKTKEIKFEKAQIEAKQHDEIDAVFREAGDTSLSDTADIPVKITAEMVAETLRGNGARRAVKNDTDIMDTMESEEEDEEDYDEDLDSYEDETSTFMGASGVLKSIFHKVFHSADEDNEDDGIYDNVETENDTLDIKEEDTDYSDETDDADYLDDVANSDSNEDDEETTPSIDSDDEKVVSDIDSTDTDTADLDSDTDSEADTEVNEDAVDIAAIEKNEVDADEINIQIKDYGPYDTQNIQEALAKAVGIVMDNESKANQAETLDDKTDDESEEKPVEDEVFKVDASDEEPQEEQIEGQMNILDWMEAVQEQKYGGRETKEFSKAELEKLLTQRENEKEAYNKLMAEKKALALSNGVPFDESKAHLEATAQVNVMEARSDLMFRAGKAFAKLEEEAAAVRQTAINEREAEKNMTVVEQAVISDAEQEVFSPELSEAVNAAREAAYEAAKVAIEAATTAVGKSSETIEDTSHNEEINIFDDESINTDDIEDSDQVEIEEEEQDLFEDEDSDEAEEDNSENASIPSSIRRFFKKYEEMDKLYEQIAEFYVTCDKEVRSNDSKRGNLIISGNKSADKTSLAANIVKGLNTLYPDMPKRVAKTTGESINHKGILKALPKLKGTAFIIEDAGIIEPKKVAEIVEICNQETDGMIIILEGSDTDIDVLLSVNPELVDRFNHRIVIKQYTVNELVEMAKRYAVKRQYAIDDSALLALYLKIDRLHSQNDCVSLEQIKEIIDRTIVKAERRVSKKIFGGFKKKRSENGDMRLLMEIDFKEKE